MIIKSDGKLGSSDIYGASLCAIKSCAGHGVGGMWRGESRRAKEGNKSCEGDLQVSEEPGERHPVGVQDVQE